MVLYNRNKNILNRYFVVNWYFEYKFVAKSYSHVEILFKVLYMDGLMNIINPHDDLPLSLSFLNSVQMVERILEDFLLNL